MIEFAARGVAFAPVLVFALPAPRGNLMRPGMESPTP